MEQLFALIVDATNHIIHAIRFLFALGVIVALMYSTSNIVEVADDIQCDLDPDFREYTRPWTWIRHGLRLVVWGGGLVLVLMLWL